METPPQTEYIATLQLALSKIEELTFGFEDDSFSLREWPYSEQ